jgi:putative lipoic acid-binding regulatory protein
MNQTNPANNNETPPSRLEELMSFPCPFNLKVVGINSPQLLADVDKIVSEHTHGFDAARDVTSKPSAKGNYMSITAMITAESKAQLDKIYLALNNHPLVKITL